MRANLIYEHSFIHPGVLYFYSFWYLLEFFFKIPSCLSRFKEKTEHATVEGGPNTAELQVGLWDLVIGGLPLSSCVTFSERLASLRLSGPILR